MKKYFLGVLFLTSLLVSNSVISENTHQEIQDPRIFIAGILEREGQELQQILDNQGLEAAHAEFTRRSIESISSLFSELKIQLEQVEENAAKGQLAELSKNITNEKILLMLNDRGLSSQNKLRMLLVDIPYNGYLSYIKKLKILASEVGYEKIFRDLSREIRSRDFSDLFIWIGNLTWGLPNTAAGVGVIAILGTIKLLVYPFNPRIGLPLFALSSNGKQIYVDLDLYEISFFLFSGKMSFGLWEIEFRHDLWRKPLGSRLSEHEGVHAIQSALLGPLYLPVIFVSYLFAGFRPNSGFMEDWASDWSGESPGR